jgi:hypothetical protein
VTEIAVLRNVVSPAPRAIWQAVFDGDAEAVPYQSPQWTDALCRSTHRRDRSRLYTFDDGVQMVLPLVGYRRVPAAADLAGSMPWGWGIGGLVSTSPVTAEHVSAVVDDLTTHAPYVRLNIRPNPRAADVWKAAMPAGAHRIARLAHAIDLDGGFDAVWHDRFSASTRKYVTKAEQSGVVVECDDQGRLVPVYYDLFREATQRWAAQQHEPLLLARLRGHRRTRNTSSPPSRVSCRTPAGSTSPTSTSSQQRRASSSVTITRTPLGSSWTGNGSVAAVPPT